MYDIIIIGGGAAGMTAALNTLRSGKKVLILEKENFGGQIALSPKVENFPTINSISGEALANSIFEQICELGAEFELEDVEKMEKIDDFFQISTNYNTYCAKAVIIATGLKHRTMGIEDEEKLIGKGVSYCAVCDGAFYQGQDVVLIGDANTALQYALLLSNFCKTVHICTLFDHFFGDKILVDRLYQRDNIKITHNLLLKKFIYHEELEGLVFENTTTKELLNIPTKAVFIAIGQIPNNEIFKDLIQLNKEGYVVTDELCHTNVEGIFAIGDCRVKKIRQLTTAIADGAIAAFEAVSYLDTLKK